MADREKVIKGLEECVGNGNCTKCQYGKGKQALSCKKLLSDALALLREQDKRIKELELEKGWDESPDTMGKW
jgi:hypothetical protein